MTGRCWAKKLKEGAECKIIIEIYNDIQNVSANIHEEIYSVFCCEIKQKWVKRVQLMNTQERREWE
jgi:hypothetical protein